MCTLRWPEIQCFVKHRRLIRTDRDRDAPTYDYSTVLLIYQDILQNGDLRSSIKDWSSCIEVTAAANSLFLNSFEQWIAASVTCSQKGTSLQERTKSIRESYEKAINANIQYHTEMARLSSDKDSIALHVAMAEAYSALVR